MVERYGIQDHSPQLTQHALQNPTPQGNWHNLGGGDAYASTSGWGGTQASSDSGGSGHTFPAYNGIPAAPLSRSIVVSVILALVLGPFGLLYTTRRGGAVLLVLMALAGYLRGGGMQALESDAVMGPIWSCGVVVSALWAFLAAKAYNHRHKEAYDALKAKAKDSAS